MGVMIEAGIIKEGTPICVPSKEVSENFIYSNCPYSKDMSNMIIKIIIYKIFL